MTRQPFARNLSDLDPAGAAALDAHLLDLRRREMRPPTLRMRQQCVRRLAEYLEPTPILTATSTDLDRWADALRERGLSARTRAVYARQVGVFYRWARRRDLIAWDPTEELIVPRYQRGLPHPIGDDVLRQALAAATPLVRAWLLLGACCGLRAAEIARLRREHVDAGGSQPTLRVVDGKGGKSREVPLPRVVRAELTPWLDATPRGRLWLASNVHPAKAVTYRITALMRSLGCGLTAHALRHRFATEAYRASRDILLVQQLLGHSSPETTQIYVQLDHGAGAELLDRIGDRLDVA